MKKQNSKNIFKGKLFVVLGFIAITFIFLIYSRYQDSELIVPAALDALYRIAIGFYIILIIAFFSIAYGLYVFLKQKIQDNDGGLLTIIAQNIWDSKSRRIFLLTFVGYGIFFTMSSGMLVYQPDVIFSVQYGAEIPSVFLSPCCNIIGYMPKILVYITEHVGLQIIPLNLVLQLVVSYLVGLNMALAVKAISIAKKMGGLTSTGAITGLFIACPTCAGTFLSLFVGTASGIGISLVLLQLQTLFIAISIPVLLLMPFFIAKKLRNAEGCKTA